MAFSFSGLASLFSSPLGTALLQTVAPAAGAAALGGLNTAAVTSVKSAVTTLNNGVDLLTSAFHTFEASNPVVSTAVATLTTLAPSLGLTVVPSEDQLVTHVKAAIADVAAIFGVTATPAASVTAPVATPAA